MLNNNPVSSTVWSFVWSLASTLICNWIFIRTNQAETTDNSQKSSEEKQGLYATLRIEPQRLHCMAKDYIGEYVAYKKALCNIFIQVGVHPFTAQKTHRGGDGEKEKTVTREWFC